MLYKSVLELIGNTPTIEIPKSITKLKNINLYCKCELFNPFGSLKDRAAYNMIKDDLSVISEKNQTVIESSSGNTSKALGIICSMYNIQFQNVTNRIKIEEVRNIFKVLGLSTKELPGLPECPDPTNPNDSIYHIEHIISSNPEGFYHTGQYNNPKNTEVHFEHTGKEILEDLGFVDFFLGVLGTAGSSGGITKFLKTKNSSLQSIGVIAKKGNHIPGIRNHDEMHEVGIFDPSLYDKIIEIDTLHAIDGMLDLNRKLGILGGPTSGAAFQASLDYLRSIDQDLDVPKNAVFVVCDRMEWYISYLQKYRPDLFDTSKGVETIHNLSEEDLSYAKTISPEDLKNEEILKSFSLIIDTRGNLAYRNFHIPNSINLTDNFLEELISNGTPFTKNQKILLVCINGSKTQKFSAFLNKKGLNTYSLTGGLIEYKSLDLPLESSIERTVS